MARFDYIQSNFTRGELAPRLQGRTDFTGFVDGVSELQNFIVSPLGAAVKRPGTRFVAEAASTAPPKVVPFEFNVDVTYLLEFGPNVLRFFTDGGQLQTTGVTASIDSPTFGSNADADWTTESVGAGTVEFAPGAAVLDPRGEDASALIRQAVSINESDTVHVLFVRANRGAASRTVGFEMRVKTTATGSADLLSRRVRNGWHIFEFDPGGNSTVYVEIFADFDAERTSPMQIEEVSFRPAGPLELPTPWGADAYREIDWTQSADILFIAQGSQEPMELQRFSFSEFSLVPFDFRDGPYLDDEEATLQVTTTFEFEESVEKNEFSYGNLSLGLGGGNNLTPGGLAFRPDGLLLIVKVDSDDDGFSPPVQIIKWAEFNLTSPFDVTTATLGQTKTISIDASADLNHRLDSNAFQISDNGTQGIQFLSDGGVVGLSMTSPWDISTLFTTPSENIRSASFTAINGGFINPSLNKAWHVAESTEDINEYTLPDGAWEPTNWTFVQNKNIRFDNLPGFENKNTFFPTDVWWTGPNIMFISFSAPNATVVQYTVSSDWDISTAIATDVFTLSANVAATALFAVDETRIFANLVIDEIVEVGPGQTTRFKKVANVDRDVFTADDVGRLMRIQARDVKVEKTEGDGATDQFPFEFFVPSQDAVRVTATNTTSSVVQNIASGSTVEMFRGTDFSLETNTPDPGGIVDFGLSKAPEAGIEVTISRDQSFWSWGEIIEVNSPRQPTLFFRGDGGLESTDEAQTWRLGAWGDRPGWPQTVEFHNQRLVFGGSQARPQSVWLGQVADFGSFAPTLTDGTVKDDNAISVSLATQQVNFIRWLASISVGLGVGTSGSEFLIRSASTAQPLAPTSVEAIRQTTRGSEAFIPPVQVGGSVFFVQRGGRTLRELVFDFNVDGLVATDVSLLSQHLLAGRVTRIAYQQEPNSVVWATTADGTLLSFTLESDQRVFAWAKHALGGTVAGKAQVLDLATIRQDARDQLWVAVSRTINGAEKVFIEVLEPAWDGVVSPLADAFFVDAGLGGTFSSPQGTVSNLDHLEGEQVNILADGQVIAPQAVTGGSVSLPNPATIVRAGLGYSAKMATMPINAVGGGPNTRAKAKRISEMHVLPYQSTDLEVGGANPQVLPVAEPGQFSSELVSARIASRYARTQIASLQSDQPLPATLLSLILEMEFSDA